MEFNILQCSESVLLCSETKFKILLYSETNFKILQYSKSAL